MNMSVSIPVGRLETEGEVTGNLDCVHVHVTEKLTTTSHTNVSLYGDPNSVVAFLTDLLEQAQRVVSDAWCDATDSSQLLSRNHLRMVCRELTGAALTRQVKGDSMTDHDVAMAMYVRRECGNCTQTFDALPHDLPFYCERCRNTAIRLFTVMACPTDPTRNYLRTLKGTA